MRLVRELRVARQLDERAPAAAEPQQFPEPRLVQACIGRRTAAMVDQQPDAAALQKRRKRRELVVPYLQRNAHVERVKVGEQRARREVAVDTVVRRIEGDADHTAIAQRRKLGPRRVVRDDGDALVATRATLDRVEEAPIVLFVA